MSNNNPFAICRRIALERTAQRFADKNIVCMAGALAARVTTLVKKPGAA